MSLLTKLLKVGALGLASAYIVSTVPFAPYIQQKIHWVVEKRWGAVVKVQEKPGLHFKDRFYIPGYAYYTKLERLDNRLLEYVDKSEKTMTADRKPIDLSRYSKWRITDPKKFAKALRTEKKAQTILDDNVFVGVWETVAAHTFIENLKDKRKEIREEIIHEGNELVNKYGMDIPDIRVKKLNIPEEARPKIHARMIEEQLKQAAGIEAEGMGEKKNILGKKERVVKTLIAEGKNQAEEIVGQAEREVAEIFQKAYESDMDFYKFYEEMKTIDKLAESNPTIVVSPKDNPVLEYIFHGGVNGEEKQDKE